MAQNVSWHWTTLAAITAQWITRGMMSRSRRDLTHHRCGIESLTPPPAPSVTTNFTCAYPAQYLYPVQGPAELQRKHFFVCLTPPFSVKLPLSTPAFLYLKAFQLHSDSRKTPVLIPVLLKLQFGGLIPLTHGVWIQLSFSRASLSPRAFRGEGL